MFNTTRNMRMWVIGLLLVLTTPTEAVQTVTNLNDSGAGSLRGAIAAAAATDTIVFSPGLTGTITLTSGQLIVNKNLTITGPGAGALAVSGNNASRVFRITDTVTISGLTIRNGSPPTGSGGGIIVDVGGNLTLSACVVTNNVNASGIGGIFVQFGGTMTVNSCSITNNSGNSAGGIGGPASITVTNSLLADNTSATRGAALNSELFTTVLTNVTISGNTNTGTDPGGVVHVFVGGNLMLDSCTLAGNNAGSNASSAAVFVESGTAQYRGTIVSGNTPRQFGNEPGETLTSLGHNISSDNTGNLTATGDRPNTDPRLGPLANNGGPTLTYAPLPGNSTFGTVNSPAIDGGNPTIFPASDQRGAPRPAVAGCFGITRPDIGAVEVQRHRVTNTNNSGAGSLRQAVLDNNAFGGSVICFSLAAPATITIPTGELAISRNVMILGPGANALQINGGGANRVFSIASGVTANISGLTITGGVAPVNASGGGILNSGTLTMRLCAVMNSTANSGGGIANFGQLTLRESLLKQNTAAFGAAVQQALGGTNALLTNVTISGNVSTSNVTSGIVEGRSGLIRLEYCTVANNTYTANGSAGIFATGATSTVRYHGTIVSGNTNGITSQQFVSTFGGALTSQGFNISSDGTGNLTAAGDQPNTNPQLAALANNGGPTQTRALLLNSTAIDLGDPTNANNPATDQRLVTRPLNGDLNPTVRADIGAFERSGIGAFDLSPADAAVAVNEPLSYAYSWTVPDPANWHGLQFLQLRIRTDSTTILWVHWDEASNLFHLVNPQTGQLGPGYPPGSNQDLQTPYATLHLLTTTVVGSGPTGPSVTLNLSQTFQPPAAGHTFVVEVAAGEDAGSVSAFAQAGTVAVNSLDAGDVNGDGVTNVDDLLGVITAWGACPAPSTFCPADFNGDGIVNVDDLLIVIINWG